MTRQNKHYSHEFKQEAVRLALSGEKSKAQTARDLGINEGLLYKWIDLYGPTKPGEPAKLAPDERAELQRLRRDNLRLQQERDILKKAIGIFSEELR
jgi:transposase